MARVEQPIRVLVNGRPRELPAGSSLGALLQEMGLDQRFLVIEHNGEPLPREGRDARVLHDGDRLELVRPVAGG